MKASSLYNDGMKPWVKSENTSRIRVLNGIEIVKILHIQWILI